MSKEKFKLTVPIIVSLDRKKGGFLNITFADCEIKIVEGEKEYGRVSGCLGGGVELKLNKDGRTFFISAKDLWNSFVVMLNKPEYKLTPIKKGRKK